MEYPKTIYVQHEEGSDGENLFYACEELVDIDDGRVAIYELKKVTNKRSKSFLEDKPGDNN